MRTPPGFDVPLDHGRQAGRLDTAPHARLPALVSPMLTRGSPQAASTRAGATTRGIFVQRESFGKDDSDFPVNQTVWRRFPAMATAFLRSEVGGRALAFAVLLFTLLVGVNGLNVVNSYVGRDFMTAIAERHRSAFVWTAVLYIGVFGASTVVAVFQRYCEESLGLLFREWLTKRCVAAYLDNRTYHRLKAGGVIDNPDERIADDIRTFTVTSLSFLLMTLNSGITVIAFSGVLWSISWPLFFIALTYAGLGSYLAIRLGRPLIGLNFKQLDREADFRAALIHVRENAESIALSRREGRTNMRLLQRVDALVANMRRIIVVNRTLGFFTTGYNYMIQVIPVLVVAPLFMRGDVEFGVITQSAMAFAMLLGAFSLVVNQFQAISSYTAVVSRLSQLWDATDDVPPNDTSKIQIAQEEGHIVYEHVSLYSSEDGRPILKDLSISIPRGMRLLITGPNEAAMLDLFRATAGIGGRGEGRIIRPSLDQIRFLPQRAYLYPGTLRELLLRSGEEREIDDARLLSVLEELGLRPVLDRAGGLDVEQDWQTFLSLGEEQLLAFTRLVLAAPQFAFLDRVYTALSPEQATQILLMLSLSSITFIALDESDALRELYDAVLAVKRDGSWKLEWNR